MRRHVVHGGEREAGTLAVQHVVTLRAVVHRRTDGCAEVRAVGVVEPVATNVRLIARISLARPISLSSGDLPTAPENVAEVARHAQRLEATKIVRGGVAHHVQVSLAGFPLSGTQIIDEMRLGVPRQDLAHLSVQYFSHQSFVICDKNAQMPCDITRSTRALEMYCILDVIYVSRY